jgi:hypothetical protein
MDLFNQQGSWIAFFFTTQLSNIVAALLDLYVVVQQFSIEVGQGK